MRSITYYIVALVLKLKGVKKTFSKSPIDYKKLRKDDIITPKKKDTLGLASETSIIAKSKLTKITPKEISNTNKIILYIHGGAFVCGPAEINWNSISKISKKSKTIAFLVNYPKAPEHNIREINKNIDTVYDFLLQKYKPENIILLGDSVGGTLSTLLVQRLIQRQPKLVPNQLVLLSPVMNATLDNPKISNLDHQDIMLSREGVLSAKKMCAQEIELHSPEISPNFGETKGFPRTTIFIAENDIMRADEEIFVEKLKSDNIPLEVIYGKKMPHIWAFLPIMKEAKIALNKMAEIIISSKN